MRPFGSMLVALLVAPALCLGQPVSEPASTPPPLLPAPIEPGANAEPGRSDVDREALADYVRARKPALQGCYQRELVQHPSLEGKVVVRFSITPNGRADEIVIEENTLGNDLVAECLRGVISAWDFPFRPESAVTVAYPFVFSPPSAAAPIAMPPMSLMPGTNPPSGYPYSPAGAGALGASALPVEPGLMVSESLFGALTAAGLAIVPYYLFTKNLMLDPNNGIDPTAKAVIFAVMLATVPLSVSQTELSIANGSRFFTSDSWPASLSGLGAEAAVFGLWTLLGGINGGGTSEAALIIGSVAFVPLLQMAVINLTKTPRGAAAHANLGSVLGYTPERGLQAGLPILAPLLGGTRPGGSVGVSMPLAAGVF